MTINTLLATLVCVMPFAMPQLANANTLFVASSPFVDHPVHHPIENRSSEVWKSQVSTWGENLAEEVLRLSGFNKIYEVKNGSNHGIDRIALKRMSNGELLDVKLVEVKTDRNEKPKLGNSRSGPQLSGTDLDRHLRNMRNSSDPSLKTLGLEISRFHNAKGAPVDSLGELIHVNTKTGAFTTYSADGRPLSSQSIERLLIKVQRKATTQQARNWATGTLSQWDQIRSANMSTWLGNGTSQQGSTLALSNASPEFAATRTEVLRSSKSAIAKRLLQKTAGHVALFIAVAVDAKDLYDTEYAYRTGAISVRQRNIRLVSTVGGMTGAILGASAGGLTGAWVGGLGGPIAWITVPAGGAVGVAVGGVGGYFGGAAVAGYGATEWYNSIDASVRDKFEAAWLNLPGFDHE